ncbi:phage tail tape measure protein [Aquihabitans sp. G128]|uniref:phage tail tape measure protein n=1 Tax=Aquihabitans sp. G128 TaxID=2849779 RepID=UPI001C21BEE7|nr:phage tail tape measure protein [Aquihabitans sp. G128]QXC59327.1 phage tail tape measure protein [Aquihabitans sp. G128]
MGDRELPELRSRLRLDTTDLTRAQGAAERFVTRLNSTKIDTKSLDDFANKADQLGSKFTRNVTLPVLAGATAATKLAVDFESSFTQMQTLAGVTGDEVEGLKQHVLDLAKETGRSPDELAKGLYFIRSAGIDGATALDVLDASAKGAAIGLGDAASVADVLTSAINTYGAENLSAADAASQLAAAVAAGKGEAADFAPQLGRLLPIAQNLGVGFDQVAGAVSFLTQTNGDVAQSATMVAGVFQKLLAPVGTANDTLEKYGLTSDGVRKFLAENGLIATLQMLNDKLGGNREALRAVFQDTEAVNGVLGLLRNNGADAAKVIDDVTGSTNYLADAYKKLDDDPATNFKRDLAELQAQGIALGQKLVPLLADLAANTADVVGWFARLPEPVQTSLLAFVGLAAAIGPVAKTAGFATNAVSLLMKAAKSDALFSFSTALKEGAGAGQGFAASAGNAINAVGGLGPIAGVAAAGLAVLIASYLDAANSAKLAKEGAEALREEAERTGESLEETFNRRLARTLGGARRGG